jgi:CHAD domain-containing protein
VAKARPVPIPTSSDDPLAWITEVLRIRFGEVAKYLAPALHPDQTKGVHDMRVATRRLRTAMRDFDRIIDDLSDEDERKRIKKIADDLGAVRDHDVAIAAFERLAAKADVAEIKNGIDKLIEARRIARGRAFEKLKKAATANSIKKLRDQFTAKLDSAAGQPALFDPGSVKSAGRQVILAGVDRLARLGPGIFEPDNGKALHKLRIAAKRLRYAIELFAPCWDGAIDSYAAELAKFQSHLGNVHDCDTWIGDLRQILSDGKGKKTARSDEYQAAAWLMSQFLRHRTRAYRSALKLWTHWEQNDFLNELIDAVKNG